MISRASIRQQVSKPPSKNRKERVMAKSNKIVNRRGAGSVDPRKVIGKSKLTSSGGRGAGEIELEARKKQTATPKRKLVSSGGRGTDPKKFMTKPKVSKPTPKRKLVSSGGRGTDPRKFMTKPKVSKPTPKSKLVSSGGRGSDPRKFMTKPKSIKETTPRGSEFKSKVTKPTPKVTKPTPKATSYSIKSGDTLSQIAKKAGTTLKALLAANPSIKDPNKIRVGQKIKLSAPVANRKSVYQGITKKQMAGMQMPKKDKIISVKSGGTVKRMGGGKVMGGSQLVASLYDN
tara:strand:+ start:233 stop:1096 length:864 start_codon:yes stop_codon:yes gene_type:complete